jgi:uncharacterized membrane protein
MSRIILGLIGYRHAMRPKTPVSAMPRFDAVDALRGLAMVWMTAFHFCFDLNQFGYIKQDFYRDPLWTWQRTLILSLFLFCAGMGQAIAVQQGQSWPRFWRRWIRVLGCALLVTAGSWWMYPQSFIYFGVLHGMALMLIIARLTAHWGGWLWGLGAAAIAFKFLAVYLLEMGSMGVLANVLNSAQLNWLGLVTRKPITEDYVPLLPWLGVVWWGVASGTWLSSDGAKCLSWRLPTSLRSLATIGRWSLSYYLLHQPVMIGALMALAWLAK